MDAFFPGGRREEICQSLIVDLLTGKRFLELVGPEGSGKTLICRLIADRLTETFEMVFPDMRVSSFGELTRNLLRDLEPGDSPEWMDKLSEDAVYERLRQALDRKWSEGITVVLVVDDADQVAPLVLEHLLNQVGDGPRDLPLSLLLAGRPELDDLLQRLERTDPESAAPVRYELPALTDAETRQYIMFRLDAAGLPREQCDHLFPETVLERIASQGQGIPRTINMLASRQLPIPPPEPAAAEEAEDGGEDAVLREEKTVDPRSALRRESPAFPGKRASGHCSPARSVAPSLPPEPAPAAEPQKKRPAVLRSESAPAQRVEDRWPDGMLARKSSAVPWYDALWHFRRLLGLCAAVALVLLLIGFWLHRSGNDALRTVPGEPGEPLVTASVAPPPADDVEAVYRERLAASARWLTGIYRDEYTIQLAEVPAAAAREEIVARLAREDYWRERDTLYILRRTNPATVFLFWGRYPTLEEADAACRLLPETVQQDMPRPVAISEVLDRLAGRH
ncbi:MAG: AAA family ATPase [Desulfobulbus sp.]|jgi:type II secretory pathway predicted ATPase ExeA/septal ring-binding cell division protein DamX